MHKILVFGMTENLGGVESFLMNYYRRIDREKLQFDFLCNSHNSIAYEDEILSMGGRTFHITARSVNALQYKKEMEDVFRRHAIEWSAIWVNVSSLANIDYLKIAKRYNIPKRIIHSHNSQNMDNRLRGLLHNWNKKQITRYATDYWACAENAAHWFYQDNLMPQVMLVHNAIDLERVRFDEKKRIDLRKKYGWENRYIIGNVGRLHFQKNQSFLIDIFRFFHQDNPEALLILVGQGEDEEKLRRQVAEYGLDEHVFFAGLQSDVQAWLSCFDFFLFPSRFEGLSVAALEAQANGLPVLASADVIPEETRMNENFYFYSLDNGAEAWSKKIEELRLAGRKDYRTVKEVFAGQGYDIETEARKLQQLLLK